MIQAPLQSVLNSRIKKLVVLFILEFFFFDRNCNKLCYFYVLIAFLNLDLFTSWKQIVEHQHHKNWWGYQNINI